jgi:hypothetical protein
MNTQLIQSIVAMLPENTRSNAKEAINKMFQILDPSKIKTQADATKAIQSLKSQGLPPDIFNAVNNYLNNPLATPIMSALGINKEEFKNGLQSVFQPDTPSALTSKSSLLSGIDQLKK